MQKAATNDTTTKYSVSQTILQSFLKKLADRDGRNERERVVKYMDLWKQAAVGCLNSE